MDTCFTFLRIIRDDIGVGVGHGKDVLDRGNSLWCSGNCYFSSFACSLCLAICSMHLVIFSSILSRNVQ